MAGVTGITLQWREAVYQRGQAVMARDDAITQERAARKAEGQAVASEQLAQKARTDAENNARIAEIQATLALNTIQKLVILTQSQLNTPGTSDFKKSVLDTALGSIGQVSENYEKSTSKEATAAAIHQQLGTLFQQLGQSEKALDQYQRLLAISAERVKIKEYSDPSRKNLATAHLSLADVGMAVGRDMNAALEHYREALKLWQDIYDHPKDDGFQLDRKQVTEGLAEANQRVGVTLYRLGDLKNAVTNFRRAPEPARGAGPAKSR